MLTMALANPAVRTLGPLDLLKCLRDLFIEDVGVACCRLDVSVIERSLHELEVAGVAKQLRPQVVSDVVEAEILNACLFTEPTPLGFCDH